MITKERKGDKLMFFGHPIYILSRLIFEILIVICKNRGVIQLEESLKNTNRIGMYYQYLLKELDGTDNRVLSDIITAFGLGKRPISFGRGMYVLKIRPNDNIFDICKKMFKAQKKKISGKEVIIQNGGKINIKERIELILKSIDDDQRCVSYFQNLSQSANANIYSNFSNIHDHTFKNIQKESIVCTDLALFHYKSIGLKSCNTVF